MAEDKKWPGVDIAKGKCWLVFDEEDGGKVIEDDALSVLNLLSSIESDDQLRRAIYCCKGAVEHYYRMKSSRKSKVYFIEAEGLNRIKIGCSDHPEQRLRDLSTGSAVKLRLMKVIHGDRRLEKRLQRLYGHLRIDGEWFHGSFDLRDCIEEW